MKTTLSFLAAIVCVLSLAASPASGQTSGDFRSATTGNWNAAATWQTFDGSVWNAAVNPPDGISGTITIQPGHTITVPAGKPDTINGAAIVVNGYLKDSAYISMASGSMIVNNGATYELAHPTTSGQGIPTATWNTGSTCLVTGVTSSVTGINAAQNFYNFTWNCPGQSASVNIAWQGGTTIAGTLTVTNTNWNHASTSSPTYQLRLFGASGSCNLNNVVVNGYSAVLTPQGSAYADTVIINGDVTLSKGGMFSLSNNSGGVTMYYLKGNLTVIDSSYIGKSNSGNASKLIFCKSGSQSIVFPSTGATLFGAPNIVVNAGSTLNMGTSVFSGAGSFQLQPGASIGSGHVNGLNGNITCTGANGGGDSLISGANYIFNGSSAQVTGTLLPSTIKSLTINNASGLTLSGTDTISGILTLANGVLKIGAKNIIANSTSGGSATSYVAADSGGTLKVNGVGVSQTIFPIGTTGGYAPFWITNSGTVDTMTASVAIDTAGGTKNGGGRVKVKWVITENTPGGTNAVLQFGWVPSLEDPLFSVNRSGNAKIFRLSDTAQAGTGAYTLQLASSPYAVSRGGITSLGAFAVGNFTGFVAGDGDYRSHQSGPWSDVNTWERNNGTSWIYPAPSAPTYTDSAIAIQNGHTVELTDSVYADQITVSAGGTLKIDSTKTLVVADGTGADLTLLGSLVNAGTLTFGSGATFVVASGGTYEHAQNGGTIPATIWNTNSLCKFTGITTATLLSGGAGQNFCNVEWNCPAQTGYSSLGLNGATISGYLRITNTNTGSLFLFDGSSGSVTIDGDLIMQAGTFSTQGTSNTSSDTVKHYGNISVTGGSFALYAGSSGINLWYLYSGNFSASNASVQNWSSGTGNARFIFAKSGVQKLTISALAWINGGFPIEVSPGTTLDMGTSVIEGFGSFRLDPGATLECAHEGGVDSSISTYGGTKILSKAANYIFDGLTPQVTGVSLPDTVNNLTISDTMGVRLSSKTAVNGVLSMAAGKFAIGSKNLAAATINGVNSSRYIVTDSGGTVTRYGVGTVQTLFPIGTTTAYSPVWITNGGTVDTFAVAVTPDSGGTRTANGRVKLKWDISEKTAGGSNAMLQFGWNASQEDANFSASRTTNDLFVHLPDTVQVGTGNYTAQFTTQPYTLSRGGVTSFGTFTVGRLGGLTLVDNAPSDIPKEYGLAQNYPNPFNPSTKIYYQLPKASQVSLVVYNVLGQQVATLVDRLQEPGSYTVTFSIQNGRASGVYFYRLTAGSFVSVKKMLLVK